MSDNTLSEEQIQRLVQSVQSAEQVVQEVKQTLTNAGVLQKDVASGSANLGINRFTEDIGADEAHVASVLSQTRSWNLNDKWLIEKAQSHDAALKAIEIGERQLALKQAQHDFAHKQKMDSIEVDRRENNRHIECLASRGGSGSEPCE